MRFSQFFLKTLREAPADAETASHQLMLRAGLIAQVAAGVYSYLPLGWRVLSTIERIVREEMNAAGAQELRMPVLQPAELWRESGRDALMDDILFRLADRREHELVLGPTHEEVITDLVRDRVQSYRDLPLNLYQIQTKFRDEPRPRAGLLRTREFTMKDAYSFDPDWESLDHSYSAMASAYRRIFARCGLDTVAVEADSGAIGGKDSQEYMVLADSGEDRILRCPDCRYAANAEKASFLKTTPERASDLAALEEVSTPGAPTIEAVAAALGIEPEQTIKTLFYVADGTRVALAEIRGDLGVNEVKLKNALKAGELRLASEEEVRAAGAIPGYGSHLGLGPEHITLVVDDSVQSGVDYVAGANKEDTHVRHVFWDRDWQDQMPTYVDIAAARAGLPCPRCHAPLGEARGIEVGHIFKLGTRYSEAMGARFLDQAGEGHPIVMGCYGLGVTRVLAAAIEQHHDEKGIVWPAALAPFPAELLALNLRDPAVRSAADALYGALSDAGIDVLYDDRDESAGVKFNDADLLGLPARLVISPRTLKEASVELQFRADGGSTLVPLTDAVARLQETVTAHYEP